MLAPVSGCSLMRRAEQAGGGPAPYREPIALHVKNDNYLDMTIAVVSRGVSRRIGMVVGNSAADFSIDQTFVFGNEFSLTATPIGGSGRASSGSLFVSEGQSVDFLVGSMLRQSSAIVR